VTCFSDAAMVTPHALKFKQEQSEEWEWKPRHDATLKKSNAGPGLQVGAPEQQKQEAYSSAKKAARADCSSRSRNNAIGISCPCACVYVRAVAGSKALTSCCDELRCQSRLPMRCRLGTPAGSWGLQSGVASSPLPRPHCAMEIRLTTDVPPAFARIAKRKGHAVSPPMPRHTVSLQRRVAITAPYEAEWWRGGGEARVGVRRRCGLSIPRFSERVTASTIDLREAVDPIIRPVSLQVLDDPAERVVQ